MTLRALALFLFVPLLSACGTYSVMRPADTLREHELELNAGGAVSTLPEVIPLGKIDYGVTDWLEVGAQYEIYSLLGGFRIGPLHTEENGIALAVGLQVGEASILRIDNDLKSWSGLFVFAPNFTLGRRFGATDLYLGGKVFFAPESARSLELWTTKLGVRVPLKGRFSLTLEGGVTVHRVYLDAYHVLGEAGAALTMKF